MVVIWDNNLLGNTLENVIGDIRERSLLRIVKWSTLLCHFKLLCIFEFSTEYLQKKMVHLFFNP